MGKMMFAMGSIEFSGDGTEALKAVGQLLERVLPGPLPPLNGDAALAAPSPIAAIEQAPKLRKKWTRRATSEGDEAKPKRTWSRRKKVLPIADPIEELPSGPLAETAPRTTAEQEELRAKAGAPSLADRIADLLGKHSKLSKVQIAMKLLTSEKAVGIAMGYAKGRFVMDDDLNFSLAK